MIVPQTELIFGADHAGGLDAANFCPFDLHAVGQPGAGKGNRYFLPCSHVGSPTDDGMDGVADVDPTDGKPGGIGMGLAFEHVTDDHAAELRGQVVDSFDFQTGHGQAFDQFGPVPGEIDVFLEPIIGNLHGSSIYL